MENDLELALDVLPQEDNIKYQDVVKFQDANGRDQGNETAQRPLFRPQDEPCSQSMESYERKAPAVDARAGDQGKDRNKAPVKSEFTAQNWSGPDDPENPHNWQLWKRIYNTAATGLLAFTA